MYSTTALEFFIHSVPLRYLKTILSMQFVRMCYRYCTDVMMYWDCTQNHVAKESSPDAVCIERLWYRKVDAVQYSVNAVTQVVQHCTNPHLTLLLFWHCTNIAFYWFYTVWALYWDVVCCRDAHTHRHTVLIMYCHCVHVAPQITVLCRQQTLQAKGIVYWYMFEQCMWHMEMTAYASNNHNSKKQLRSFSL